jgi:hypothetical protein
MADDMSSLGWLGMTGAMERCTIEVIATLGKSYSDQLFEDANFGAIVFT